ncbi:MAG: T9SS type A sorting domain-containing protein [Candidatus Marinimicrobia bacterium]|nr:T9SS type A sorting domain-containing protein [Candidatus Neomarinimicrobiota bacterium]
MSKRLVLIVFTGLLLGYVAFAQDGPVYDPENFVIPYIMKAPEEITVDGDLSEWGFAFPIVFNTASVPDSSRCHAWFPADNEDLSGVLYMMYDDEYFYFAANVRDDAPAHLSDAAWAADAIEFYLSDVDIGDALHGDHEGFLNTADAMELQFTITFGRSSSGNPDSITVIEWYALGRNPWFSGTDGEAVSGANHVKFVLWEDEDGYTVEGKICLDSLKNSAGRKFSFTPGTRIAATWSLFDIDETESSADFHGYQYTCVPGAPWQGPLYWQYADVLGISVMEYEDYKVGIDVFNEDYVNTFKLFPNFPNPFNPTTVISYELDRPMNISMKVYNLKGELVKTVFENRPQEAGRHYFTLYMGDMPSGIYLCVIDNGRSRLIRKMTLVK